MWFHASEHPSLRRRLLVVVLAAIALASLAQGVVAYRGALRTADAIFDRYLENLAQAVQGGETPGGVDLYEYSIRAWGPGGVQVYRGLARVPDQPVIGFSDTTVDGARFRVYQLRAAGRTIQVAQDLDARQARARSLAVDAVLPLALLAPVLMLAVWLLIERSVAPIERVRQQVATRRAEDLSPLAEQGLPQEIVPLVGELNQLLGRARQNLQAQQRFIADAAHELRSPLAALKLQAQALSRSDGPARDAAIVRLNQGIERLITLASQLLALARAEAATAARREPVDLEALCRDGVAELLPLAHARDIDLGLTHSEAASVQGDLESLRMLVRNLLDNAVKYSPEGGKVDISIRREPAAAVLCVEDSGPGIADEQRRLALEPFARLPGQERVPGSGLGLAIVAAVAHSHGAQLELEHSRQLGGLLARVRFPAAA
jgi:two-component system, OmpR family, sensor kinase